MLVLINMSLGSSQEIGRIWRGVFELLKSWYSKESDSDNQCNAMQDLFISTKQRSLVPDM